MTAPPNEPLKVEPQEAARVAAASVATNPRRRRIRYFLLQLLPVTAGILIALLIDGLLELRRQDALVAEAHAALAAEIADNAIELSGTLPSLLAMADTLQQISEYVDDVLDDGMTEREPVTRYGMDMPSLNHASWDSAERTGALGYMDYAQVEEYAELYALQELVLASQSDLLDRFPSMGQVLNAMQRDDPTAYSADLKAGSVNIIEFLIAIYNHRGLIEQLREGYRTIPCYAENCARAD